MNDLFAGDQNQQQQHSSFLEQLVGENKKFKDAEALARGKAESDAYIPTLEAKLDELVADNKRFRDEINAGRTMQEMLDQLTSQQQEQNNQEQNKPPQMDAPKQPAFDAKQLENLVSSKIMEHESTKKQNDNLNMVLSRLQEHYGNEYQNVLTQQTDELGLTQDLVNNLARQHPKALMKTLGIDAPKSTQSFQAPPRSSTGFTPRGSEKRTWTYYQELKKKDPDAYWSPKNTAQMFADAQSLGDSFKDGDWSEH